MSPHMTLGLRRILAATLIATVACGGFPAVEARAQSVQDQQAWFARQQAAMHARQQNFSSYLGRQQAASDARIRATNNWDHQVLRNERLYINPQTGARYWVPN